VFLIISNVPGVAKNFGMHAITYRAMRAASPACRRVPRRPYRQPTLLNHFVPPPAAKGRADQAGAGGKASEAQQHYDAQIDAGLVGSPVTATSHPTTSGVTPPNRVCART
jgi:hypothetical protein